MSSGEVERRQAKTWNFPYLKGLLKASTKCYFCQGKGELLLKYLPTFARLRNRSALHHIPSLVLGKSLLYSSAKQWTQGCASLSFCSRNLGSPFQPIPSEVESCAVLLSFNYQSQGQMMRYYASTLYSQETHCPSWGWATF